MIYDRGKREGLAMGLGAWYDERVVPRIIKCACSSPAIAALREKVVPKASGKVFEIGCGGGINQQFYDPGRVVSYSGMDPSTKGLDFAEAAIAKKGWKADIRKGFGESIPFEDESFDCVVCTFTLCSVGDQAQTLKELRRILRPAERCCTQSTAARPMKQSANGRSELNRFGSGLRVIVT